MVFITAIVFRKEYVNCVNKAKDKIIQNNTVSNDDLSEIFQRFYDLNVVLQKADEMLSPIIGLNIIIALGVLCGASYASLIGDGSLKEWHFLTIQHQILAQIDLMILGRKSLLTSLD